MKTLQQCKDDASLEIVKVVFDRAKYAFGSDTLIKILDRAAELYAQSAKEEAWDEGYNDGQSCNAGYQINPYKS